VNLPSTSLSSDILKSLSILKLFLKQRKKKELVKSRKFYQILLSQYWYMVNINTIHNKLTMSDPSQGLVECWCINIIGKGDNHCFHQ